MAQWVKNLPSVQETQETWVWSLSWADSLEKEMATYSSVLAWEIPSTEEPGGLQSKRSQRVGHDWVTFHALEKERATHSRVLAWWIPGTGKPGGLPTMGLHRVGHYWSDLAAAAATVSDYGHLLMCLLASRMSSLGGLVFLRDCLP